METNESLTRSQAARRKRVVDTAMTLGAKGGYDAVQMRDIAREAGVALGTIYRYFSSKDHLLAAALVAWMEDLERRVTQRPPTGDTTADRVASVMRRAHHAMERQPQLAEAVVMAMVSPDPATADSQRQLGETLSRVIGSTMSSDLDPDVARKVAEVLSHVWFSSLLAWVNGRWEIGQVGTEVQTAAHLMLDQYDRLDGPQ